MTDRPLKQGTFRNAIHGFSTWLLPLGLSFIVTPIIVRNLGNIEYGIYALVLGFIAYSFNFNIGRAVTKYIADFRAKGLTRDIPGVISATLFINTLIGSVGLIVVFLCAEWLVHDVFRLAPAVQENAVFAIRISGLIIFLLMLGQVFTSIVQGFHRFDLFARIQNFSSLAGLIGNLVLALTGFGLIALLYWNLAVVAVSCILSFATSRRLLRGSHMLSGLSRHSIRLVGGYSVGVVGYQIAANVLLLFERGWIMAKFGSESLTFYVVPMSLGILLHGFILSVTMVVFPLASELHSDRTGLLKLYRSATKTVCFLVAFPAAVLLSRSGDFLTLWVGVEFGDRSAHVLILQIAAFGFAALYVVAFQVAEGLGHTKFNFITMLIGLIVAVPLMIWLGSYLGIFGIAIARAVAFFSMLLTVIYLERSIFGSFQFDFWLKTLGILAVAGLICGFAMMQIGRSLALTWPSFVVTTIFGVAIFALVLLVLGFVTDDEKLMLKRILRST